MKRPTFYSAILLSLGAVVTILKVTGHGRPSQPVRSAARVVASRPGPLVAGPGRVEPVSEYVNLGSEISGKLKAVLAEEGDRVKRGQVIAVLENSDYRAQVASAQAQLQEREAELRKIINGARSQERAEALASVKEAEAVLNNARIEMERRQGLFREGVVSREEADRFEREYKVAKARYDETAEHHALVDAAAREEDRARAEADVALARAQLDDARARYEKTFVRSPISGIVLRRHHRVGESVTNSATTPDPVVTLGDEAALRVRVDVDETDIGKIRLGQKAYVTADAYGGKKFWGHVVRIGQELGRKNVRTDEPTERVDTKILETLIQLDDGHELPAGLRVDAFIVTSAS